MRSPGRAGSVLVVALLLIAVAGILVAAWVGVISARSGYAEQAFAAAQRRVALANSRALAQQFLLEKALGQTSGAAFAHDVGLWGGIAVSERTAAPMQSVTLAAGFNPFNPGNAGEYAFGVAVTLSDGQTSGGFARLFQVKSRSPVLAGSVLTLQVPTLTPAASQPVAATITADSTATVWTSTPAMSFSADRLALPAGFSSSLATNLAFPAQASNPRSTGLVFGGQFDAIANADAAANSSLAKAAGGVAITGAATTAPGAECDAAGNATITLATLGLNAVIVSGTVTSLTLEGQPTANDAGAASLPALIIVLNEPASLSAITLNGHNHRRLVLAIKRSTDTALTFTTAAPQWRLVLEAENTPLTLNASGVATLTGGVRTDRGISVSGGQFTLVPESDPKFLERLATRTAWLECYLP